MRLWRRRSAQERANDYAVRAGRGVVSMDVPPPRGSEQPIFRPDGTPNDPPPPPPV